LNKSEHPENGSVCPRCRASILENAAQGKNGRSGEAAAGCEFAQSRLG
jgi:hypothetical protein